MDGYFKFVLCRGGINQRKIGKWFQKSGNGWTGVSICLAFPCFTLRGFETVYYSAFSSFKGFFSFLPPARFLLRFSRLGANFPTYFPFYAYLSFPFPRFSDTISLHRFFGRCVVALAISVYISTCLRIGMCPVSSSPPLAV